MARVQRVGLDEAHVEEPTTAPTSERVSRLLGEGYRPGGLALTRRLLDLADCRPGHRLLDLGCGRGRTALLAVREYDADVDGVDASAAQVALARGAAAAEGLEGRLRFRVGAPTRLPVTDGSCDLLVWQGALGPGCDGAAAAREIARVLRPGGRAALSVLTADLARLPRILTTLTAAVPLAATRPLAEHRDLLGREGLTVRRVEDHREALEQAVPHVAARLSLLWLTAPGRLLTLGLDPDTTRAAVAAAAVAVGDGSLGWSLIVAQRPPTAPHGAAGPGHVDPAVAV